MTLTALGWDDCLAQCLPPDSAAGLGPARVVLAHPHAYTLLAPAGEFTATCTGRLLHAALRRADLPAVGDWVAMRPRPGEAHADIHAVLPRRTKFSRTAPGDSGGEQVVATNVDTVLLVTALDQNYNLRRIERYLAVAWASGAQPVVVLNKADLATDLAFVRAEVEAIARPAPVIVLSAVRGEGIEALAPWLLPGRTLALLGSSGVGKSTLINRLLGQDRQATAAISAAAGKGRHTTTRRELIVAPSGVLVIDTPGMRELQFWDAGERGVDAVFTDVTALAARCRFGNCSHGGEPGCAIQAALAGGTLEPERWASYRKLQREQAHAARQADARLARETKADWKRINRNLRQRRRFEEQD